MVLCYSVMAEMRGSDMTPHFAFFMVVIAGNPAGLLLPGGLGSVPFEWVNTCVRGGSRGRISCNVRKR